MNRLTIIGNLTADPVLRTANTAQGQVSVCSFSVAVNERRGGQETTTFFSVSAWEKISETIAKYARKGSKLMVSGPVGLRQYTKSNGEAGASLEITAKDFEFCSSKAEAAPAPAPAPEARPAVVDNDELPF